MAHRDLVGIILAAGDSTRMKSGTPKVLHPLLGRPMLEYVIRAVQGGGVSRLLVVIGFRQEMVVEAFRGSSAEFVTQEERLGTAHAVLQTASSLEGFEGDCLITCGDTPLLSEQTLDAFYRRHTEESADMTLLTAFLDNPTGYGRIIRDEGKGIKGIIEEKDATEEQRRIREINTGVYCFKGAVLFDLLRRIGKENRQGEYYLTDSVSLAREAGLSIANHVLEDPEEILGVNSRIDLARVTALIKRRKMQDLMLNGVTIIDPGATYIESDVSIGRDTVVYPFVVIEGKTVIGKECIVYPFTYIKDLCVGDGECVGNAALGPFDSSVSGAYNE